MFEYVLDGASMFFQFTLNTTFGLFINLIEYLRTQQNYYSKKNQNEQNKNKNNNVKQQNISMWNDDVDGPNDDVNAIESHENSHQRNYDKVPTPLAAIDILGTLSSQQLAGDTFFPARCEQPAWQHSPTITSTITTIINIIIITITTTTLAKTSATKMANDLSLSQVSRQILSLATTLSMSTRRLSWTVSSTRVNLLSILMTLFIALVLSARAVQGGACWQSIMDNDKCSEIYSLNISRIECCGKHPDFFYTAHDPSTVEYFFATTVGDGMACTPCVENCKHITCGPNKKCLKRKGRTKCICAPECGAAARTRDRLKIQQQQQQQQHPRHYIGANGEKVAARDIRSLSSGITHINLELDVHQNQRNILRMQSQRSQKPYASGEKPKRLIIASDLDEKTEKPTTRRLQIFSNVRHHGNGERRREGGNKSKKNKIRMTNQNKNGISQNDINGSTERQDKQNKKHKHRNHNKNKNKNHNHSPINNSSLSSKHKYGLSISNLENSNNNKNNNNTKNTVSSKEKEFIVVENKSPANYESINANDLSMLDDVYDKYNLHGFPVLKPAVSHFEHFHATNPVCGTDGRTYNSECQLKKRACRTDNSLLTVAYRGYCRTTCNGVKCLNGLTCVEDHYTIPHCIACKIDCSTDDNIDDDALSNKMYNSVERAVCGVDGKTYKSICHINRMICEIGRSIAVAYPGPCRASRITCSDINCGSKQTCLLDLLNQDPRCVSCSYKCSRKHRQNTSRYEEGKICGTNNRTYNSWCEMRKDSCATGYFIDIKTPGECK